MSRCLILLAALLFCSGCDPEASESTDTADAGEQGSGTGIVGGMLLAPGDALGPPPVGGGADPQANNPPQGNAPVQPQEPVIQPQRPADLVDKAEAMAANPNLVEVTNDVNAGDYLTAIADSYFSAASRVHLNALKYELELERNLNPDYEYPTFEKFKEVLERNNVELKGLRANQVYAYDEQAGTVCILEDQSAAN